MSHANMATHHGVAFQAQTSPDAGAHAATTGRPAGVQGGNFARQTLCGCPVLMAKGHAQAYVAPMAGLLLRIAFPAIICKYAQHAYQVYTQLSQPCQALAQDISSQPGPCLGSCACIRDFALGQPAVL